jgi:hypothetical protein
LPGPLDPQLHGLAIGETFGLRIKSFLAGAGAKVVGLSLMVASTRRLGWIDLHPADWVNCHGHTFQIAS